MEELALFILGIVIITTLARYNESNKLFWTLLTCYVLGFVGCELIYDALSNNDGSKAPVEQVQPTQALAMTSGSLVYLLADESLPTSVKVTSKPVSQAFVPTTVTLTSSYASGVTQGLYLHILPNPPNGVAIVDDS